MTVLPSFVYVTSAVGAVVSIPLTVIVDHCRISCKVADRYAAIRIFAEYLRQRRLIIAQRPTFHCLNGFIRLDRYRYILVGQFPIVGIADLCCRRSCIF